MIRRRLAGLVACGAVILATSAESCEDFPPVVSTDVATRDVDMEVSVRGDSVGSTFFVTLIGPGGAVKLVGGERLVLQTAGGASTQLRPLGGGAHVAQVAPDASAFTVALAREGEAEDAAVALQLPPLPVLSAPARAPRDEPFDVTWNADDGPQVTTLALEGSCIGFALLDVVDGEGRRTVSPEELQPAEEGCVVELTLLRVLAADVAADPLARASVRVQRAAVTTMELDP